MPRGAEHERRVKLLTASGVTGQSWNEIVVAPRGHVIVKTMGSTS